VTTQELVNRLRRLHADAKDLRTAADRLLEADQMDAENKRLRAFHDLLREQAQGDAVYYLSSIQRQLSEWQEILTTSESFYGPTIASEVAADNANWLDCFIDATKKARAALEHQQKETP
jgi:hypothetical protein